MSVDLGTDASLTLADVRTSNLALSPNGELLVFVAQKDGGRPQLYIRRLHQLDATPLPGTDDARNPFFSPDGQWIGFFAEGSLKKISVTGGAAVALAPAAESRGATWSEDGTIIYTPSGGPNTNLLKIPAGGGTATPAVTLEEGESSQRWPHVLPGGRAVLFTSTRISGQGAAGGRFDDAQIIVQRLPEGQRTVVWRGGYFARYVPTGHVLYIHRGTLFALPFDVDRLESTGQPVPVLDGISASTTTGAAQLAFANDGTLIFLAGRSTGSEAPLVWLDRAGNTAPWCAETHPRLRSGAVVELEYPAEPLTALNHA